jgi:hypothetical protein
MAANFKIYCNRTGNDLHLKLAGDFDGSSAHELVNTLRAQHGNAAKITVHTSGLSLIYPFGLDVFRKKCSINGLSRSLTFTGEYSDIMKPPENGLF